jgi:hypothetical protein
MDKLIRRGEIRPTKPGDTHITVVCGECPKVVQFKRPVIDVNRLLAQVKWRYTNESGWVCRNCGALARLKFDDLPRD